MLPRHTTLNIILFAVFAPQLFGQTIASPGVVESVVLYQARRS